MNAAKEAFSFAQIALHEIVFVICIKIWYALKLSITVEHYCERYLSTIVMANSIDRAAPEIIFKFKLATF